ncbi:MAG: hypothetical protein IPL08_00375 [Saprospiraceae bacterium]|nr:hypothetical protein [Saprospiraceae bacterium]
MAKKYTYGAEFGIDYYTSASSDKIDAKVSSASSSDVSFYPSVNYSVENEKNGSRLRWQYCLKEYDYTSIGGGFNIHKKSKNQNTEFSAKANVFSILTAKSCPQNSGPTYQPGSKGREK